MTESEQPVLTRREGAVGIITLNRPKALNALNMALTTALSQAVAAFEVDAGIRAIVVTGSDKAFAAGADIKEIQHKTLADVHAENFITATWEALAHCRKPTIAAVSGHALGGGCELALMCDIIIASDTARFALPETAIGTIPGAGGTQRLTRLVGRPVAMDMILTGRVMLADEALARGLVSRVLPVADYLTTALSLAHSIAERSAPVVMMAKQAVNTAAETTLAEGIAAERRLLYMTFALEDRREGMAAFAEKRPPRFTHR